MANLATISNNILADSGIDPIDLIVGTGTVNYVPKFTAEGTIANSQIFDNGTNVGIGTTSPSSKLDVVGAIISTGTYQARMIGAAGGAYFGSMSAVPVIFQVSQNEVARFDSSGRFGIETSNPFSKFQVNNGNIAAYNNISTNGAQLYLGDTNFSNSSYFNSAPGIGAVYSPDSNVAGDLAFYVYTGVASSRTERMRILTLGQIRLNSYGSGSFTGTPTYNLAVDVNGNIIETAGAVVDGSGTANYVTKWIDANTVGNSQIFDNGTNVGIGTASPSYKLDVSSSGTNTIRIINTASTADSYLIAQNTLGSTFFGINATGGYIYNSAALPILFYTSGSERVRITSTGNVGIGTSAPSRKLEIVSTSAQIRISDGTPNTYWDIASLFFQSNQDFIIQNQNNVGILINSSGNVGLGTSIPTSKLDVWGDIAIANPSYYSAAYDWNFAQNASNGRLAISYYGSEKLSITDAGEVLIGTTVDSGEYKLQVNGRGLFQERLVVNDGPNDAQLQILGNGTNIMSIQGRDVAGSGNSLIALNNDGGNVSIGTTANAGYKLQVAGNIASVNTGFAGLFSISGTRSIAAQSFSADWNYLRSNGANFVFGTQDASNLYIRTNDTDRMIVTTAGNVGIGNTSPVSPLDVFGIISSRGIFIAQNSGAYNVIYNASNSIAMYLGGSADPGNYYDNTYHYFRSAAGSSNYGVWNSTGLGVGTISPSTRLHVVGYARVDGGIIVNGGQADYREIIFTTSGASRWNIYTYGAEGGANSGSVLYLARYADNGDYISTVATFLRTNGYVGINNSSPTQQLHIGGNIRVTGAYYDSNNSAGTSGQVLSSTATGTDWVSLSEITGVDGTGTANYIAKWQDANTIQNSIIYDNGTNVGIGTTTPTQKLEVSGGIIGGPIYTTSRFIVDSTSNPGISDISLGSYVGGSWLNTPVGTTGWLSVAGSAAFSYSSTNLIWYTNSGGHSEKMRLTATGNVGIGTSTPSQKLEVGGALVVGMTTPAPFWNAKFKDYSDGSGIYLFSVNGGGGKYIAGNTYYYNSSYWWSDKTTSSAINLDNGKLIFYTDSGLTPNTNYLPSERMRIDEIGNVSIGGSYAATRLHVYKTDLSNELVTVRIQNNAGYADFGIQSGYARILSNGQLLYAGSDSATYFYNGGNTVMTMNYLGLVGIGTTNPITKLEVFDGDISVTTSSLFSYFNSNRNFIPNSSGVSLGGIRFRGYSTGSTYQVGSQILSYSSAAWTSVSTPSYLSFQTTASGATSPTERMIINDVGQLRLVAYGSGSFTGTRAYDLSVDSFGNIIEVPVGAGTVTGSGTANYVARWTSSSNISTGVLYDNGTNVGVGTTSPSARLTVQTTTISSADSFRVTDGTGVINIGHWDTVTNRFEFSGKPTTFIQYGAGNYISWGTNGSERMRLDASGNVGIGTTAPQYALDVAQVIRSNYGSYEGRLYLGSTPAGVAYAAGAVIAAPSPSYSYTGKLSFYVTTWGVGSDYGITEQMYIETSAADTKAANIVMLPWGGNVGIGTTNPASKLHVVETSNSETTYPLIINNQNNQAGDGWGAGMKFSTSNPLGGGNEGLKWSSIQAFDVNNYGSSSGLSFTVSHTYIKNTAMVINRYGNVGIGTTSPADKLHVNGVVRTENYYNVKGNDVYFGSGTGLLYSGSPNDAVVRSSNNVHLAIGGDPALTVTSSRNVGIGTTAPTGKVDIVPTSQNAINIARAGGYASIYGSNDLVFETDSVFYFGVYTPRLFSVNGSFYTTVSGDVGIGTSSPLRKLHVVGNFAVNSAAGQYYGVNITGGEGANPNILIGDWHNASANLTWDSAGRFLRIDSQYSTSGAPIVFSGNDAATEYMRMTAAGDVGIGTSSPITKLQVAGGVTVGSSSTGIVNFYLTRTNGGITADANYFVSGNNTPNHTWIEGGYYTGELSGVVTAPNSGYPYIETWAGQGSSTTKSFGFINKTSGTFTSADLFITLSLLRTGRVTFNKYGLGSFAGTRAYDLAVDASGNIIEVPVGAGTVTGSGTANYVARWTSSSNISTGVLYDNGTNVGIGTSSPSKSLSIALSNSAHADEGIILQSAGGYGEAGIYHDYGQGNGLTAFKLWNAYSGAQINLAQDSYSSTGSPGSIRFYTAIAGGGNTPVERMRLTSSGELLIGTTSDSGDFKLQVEGNTYISSKLSIGTAYNGFAANIAGVVYVIGGSVWVTDGYGYANASSNTGMFPDSSHNITFRNNNITSMYINSSRNVGIGTTSPTQQLHITANMALGLDGGTAGDTNNILFTTVAGNHTATINGIYYTKKGNWGGQIDIRTSYNWGYSGVDNARISLNGLADNGITFSTGASATGSVERMRIDYAGNVLIGVTSSFTIGGTAKVSIYADAPFTYGLTSTDAIYFRRYGVGQYQFQTTESGGNNGNLSLQSYGGNVGIGTTSTATKLTIGAYEGSRLPYINGTATTFNADGITVTSYNTGNAGVGGGLDLTNNVYSIGSFSPVISFSSKTQSGSYNNNYAAIYGVLAGDSGDGNWNSGHLVFATAFAYGASEKMRITNSGNVGINTSSPSYKLQVNAEGSGFYVSAAATAPYTQDIAVFRYGGNGNAVKIENQGGKAAIQTRLDNGTVTELSLNAAGGNVGIGTTSPQSGVKLDVYGAAAVAGGSEGLRIGNVGDNSAYDNVKLYYSGYNSGAPRVYLTPRTTPGSGVVSSYFHLQNSNGNSTTSNNTMGLLVDGIVGIGTTTPTSILDASVSNGATSGFRFKGWSDAGTPYLLSLGTQTYQDIFQIKSVNGLVTMGIVGSIGATPDLAFQTNTTERMRITTSGNVGIGTSAPEGRLHVSGGQLVLKGGTSTDQQIVYNFAREYVNGIYNASGHFRLQDNSLGGTVYQWDGSSFCFPNGNIGIGTTAPAYKLDVTGAARFTSSVTATGFFESSDARLKTIVKENYRLDSIVSIKPKFYEKNGKFEVGYIAQEVEQLYPHAVTLGADGYLSLSYSQVHTLKLAYLEDSVEEIKRKIAYLEQQLNNK